ncbi:hypothetical protein HNR46_004225, partial [Haloferula luteola]
SNYWEHDGNSDPTDPQSLPELKVMMFVAEVDQTYRASDDADPEWAYCSTHLLSTGVSTLNNRDAIKQEELEEWLGLSELNWPADSSGLDDIQSWSATRGIPAPTERNGAFCRVRLWMSKEFIKECSRRVDAAMAGAVRDEGRWHSFTRKAIDGSSVKAAAAGEGELLCADQTIPRLQHTLRPVCRDLYRFHKSISLS